MPDQSEMSSILLVGTDLSLLEGLAQSLSAQGHSTRVAGSFGEARELTAANRPLIAVIEREMATQEAVDLIAGVLGYTSMQRMARAIDATLSTVQEEARLSSQLS